VGKRRYRRFSGDEKRRIWEAVKAGDTLTSIASAFDRPLSSVFYVVRERGGVPPRWSRSERRLSLDEREEISRGLAEGRSLRSIATGLGRAPSTITREVSANGGREGYRAVPADHGAHARARRPKLAKLVVNVRLRAVVEAKLRLGFSPQQIAGWLRRHHPNDPEMYVSHETIYQSLFVQGRGALRKELTACLRTGRAVRRPRSRLRSRDRIVDAVPISERPAEVADRAVPGHWEGDLIIGKANKSAVATLVERSSRYLMLIRIEQQTAEAVRDALTRHIVTRPGALRRSVTWDRGVEMAQHVAFTIDTGVQVYFCDPYSPWQRPTNENTNGLVREYLPKSTDLSVHTQADLDEIAHRLNGRPRKVLDFMTPSEAFAELVATAA
jgi:transposase, IS30 family